MKRTGFFLCAQAFRAETKDTISGHDQAKGQF